MRHPEIAQEKGWYHEGWEHVLKRDKFFLADELALAPNDYEGSIGLQVEA